MKNITEITKVDKQSADIIAKLSIDLPDMLPIKDITSLVEYKSDILFVTLSNSNRIFCVKKNTDKYSLTWHCPGYGADALLYKQPNSNNLLSISPKSGMITLFDMANDKLTVLDHQATVGKLGPNRLRQFWSSPKSACFDQTGNFVFIADSGCDNILVYNITEDLQFDLVQEMPVRPGSCPREIISYNDYCYILSDGIESLYICKFDRQTLKLEPIQIVQPLPQAYVGLDTKCINMFFDEVNSEVCFYVCGIKSTAHFAVDERGMISRRTWLSEDGKEAYND